MGKSLQEIIQDLPATQQAAVDARVQELVAEELSLRDLRKARALTQARMAELLHMRQESVSRLEKRSDLLLSTLRNYVRAMGGDLKLIVQFPDRPPVQLEELMESAGGAASKLIALPRAPQPIFGSAQGQVHIGADFDEPIDGFEDYMP